MTTAAPRRVLVTGAAGRLGRVVAGLFHDAGHDVLATDIVEAMDTPYRFAQADLVDHEQALGLLDGMEVVLHIGNIPGIGPYPRQLVFNTNVSMNQNVFQGAAEQGVDRIVFASTLQLIGSHGDDQTVVNPPRSPAFPLDGSTVPDPSNVYALSKTVSEVMLRNYAERCGIDAVALRFPLLHNNQEQVFVTSGTETETDVFEGFTGLTYADAARLFLAVVERDLPGYHVFVPGNSHRHVDLAMPELIRTFYPDLPDDLPDLIDDSAISAATGWEPLDTRPGVDGHSR